MNPSKIMEYVRVHWLLLMARAKLHTDGFHTDQYVHLDVTRTIIQAAKETIELAKGN